MFGLLSCAIKQDVVFLLFTNAPLVSAVLDSSGREKPAGEVMEDATRRVRPLKLTEVEAEIVTRCMWTSLLTSRALYDFDMTSGVWSLDVY